ncbi:MAG: ribonuclease H-like domain-containing protein [Hyphomicrobiales bacterium]
MKISVYQGDLPTSLDLGPVVAVDTETLGLDPHRDRLCLVQLSSGDGNAHLVQIDPGSFTAPNLKAVLEDDRILKLFHYARFDVAVLKHYLDAEIGTVYCTKIASRLSRTYTDRHGLKDLCRELLDVDLSKVQQSSDWGADPLSEAQRRYAASDVLHLHALKQRLDIMLEREGRKPIAQACFDFIPVRAALDLAGWSQQDIFAH